MGWLRSMFAKPLPRVCPGDLVRVVGSEELRSVRSVGGFGNAPVGYQLEGDGDGSTGLFYPRESLVLVMPWPGVWRPR